jgi:methylenetetrahydrofolate dehydrogenase (NADP+) / methenyltetrahydrofolate cyclohydrolase
VVNRTPSLEDRDAVAAIDSAFSTYYKLGARVLTSSIGWPRRPCLSDPHRSDHHCRGMTLLDGTALSKKLQGDIARDVESLVSRGGRRPGLGVILVGDNPASQVYVRNKQKIAARCGLVTIDRTLPAATTAAELSAVIADLNTSPEVDGILLQLPLPGHLDSKRHLLEIDPRKDADGLHPLNQGLLLAGTATVKPCTPRGVMKLVDLAIAGGDVEADLPEADLSGKHAVVIGRSVLVGKPAGLLLLERNATVTYAHSRTRDLARLCGEADILVAAVGVPELVKGSWVKPGAIVVDVGMNRTPDGKLVGDVEFAEARHRASAITPVPGGVGPMTVLFLIENTLRCHREHTGVPT